MSPTYGLGWGCAQGGVRKPEMRGLPRMCQDTACSRLWRPGASCLHRGRGQACQDQSVRRGPCASTATSTRQAESTTFTHPVTTTATATTAAITVPFTTSVS